MAGLAFRQRRLQDRLATLAEESIMDVTGNDDLDQTITRLQAFKGSRSGDDVIDAASGLVASDIDVVCQLAASAMVAPPITGTL